MGTLVVLQQMLVIAVLVAIGFFLEKRGIVDKVSSKSISTIVIDVCNPALMLTSVLSRHISASHTDLLIAGAMAVIFYAVLVGVGFVLPKLIGVKNDEKRFFNVMCVYTNVGFIGIPVCFAILPESSMLIVLMCNVIYSLLFYTHGVTIIGGGEKISLRKILSPGTIIAILSIVIFWFRITVPEPISELIAYVGNATVFLSMMLLGVSIARSDIRKGIRDVHIWLYVAIRMVVLPALILVVLKNTGLDTALVGGMVLMATVPIGNLPLIQAEKIGADTTVLSYATAISTVVSMVTITVFMSMV